MNINAKRLHELITESNLIEGISGQREIDQSIFAWTDILASHSEPLTHEMICSLQRLITQNQDDLTLLERGHYRDVSRTNVYVGNFIAPDYSMVPGMMDNWLLDYGDPRMPFDPIEAHLRFESIHGFVDGNGRTGRMILWWQQLNKGLEPTLFLNSEKHEVYYPLFDRKKVK